MIQKLVLLFAIASVLVTGAQPASAQTISNVDTNVQTPSKWIDCPICDFDMDDYNGALTEQEVQGLLLALNDEYHAWAAYSDVIATIGAVRPFTNIKSSEAKHISTLKALFNSYDLAIPANPWLNVDVDVTNRAEACSLGVEAEIANVNLYTTLFASTSRADIPAVYESLSKASQQSHLPTFQRCSR